MRKSGKDMEYQGMYLYFNNQMYFEIISEDCGIPAGNLGMALSDLENNLGLISRIKNSDQLQIKEYDQSGKKWFKGDRKIFCV